MIRAFGARGSWLFVVESEVASRRPTSTPSCVYEHVASGVPNLRLPPMPFGFVPETLTQNAMRDIGVAANVDRPTPLSWARVGARLESRREPECNGLLQMTHWFER